MQRAEQTVTGGILIQENNVSGLFSAETCTDFLHAFQYITVAYLGLLHGNAVLLSHQEESQITHYGCYDSVLFQGSLALHKVADDCHDLVTVYNLTIFVYC